MGENSGQGARAATAQDPFRDAVAVLMAGGAGTRFWPLCTPDVPKQFLHGLAAKPLYVQAAERARGLVPWDRILVMTHARFASLVRDQTPHVPQANVILEPMRRNTAAAIILAAVIVNRRRPGSIMIVMPSDHVIGDLEAFRRTLARAAARAGRGGLGTIGIPPSCPSTEFGYLRLSGPPGGDEPVRVEQFVEKPDRARAEEYVASGRFLWNSGIFIWRTEALLAAASRHLPQVYGPIAALGQAVDTDAFAARAREAFERIESISVDYSIMEKTEDVWAVPAAFAWNDVGNWLTAADLFAADAGGNRVRGRVILDEARGNLIISTSGAPVLVSGISDCVIVQGPAGTLICGKGSVPGLKPLVERLLSRDVSGPRP